MGLCNGKSLQQTQTHLCFLQSTLVSIRESNSVYIKDSVMLNPIPPDKARPLLQFQTSQTQAKEFLEHLLCTQVRVYIQYILSTGLITACKAVISEASDDTNQALGMTIVGAAWGIGYIVGPAMSGALADPIGQYNITSKSGREGGGRGRVGREVEGGGGRGKEGEGGWDRRREGGRVGRRGGREG